MPTKPEAKKATRKSPLDSGYKPFANKGAETRAANRKAREEKSGKDYANMAEALMTPTRKARASGFDQPNHLTEITITNPYDALRSNRTLHTFSGPSINIMVPGNTDHVLFDITLLPDESLEVSTGGTIKYGRKLLAQKVLVEPRAMNKVVIHRPEAN